jgi:hypothetical protein
MGEEGGGEKDASDVQVVTQYPCAENARCEEVTTQMSVATENVGNRLVAILFCSTRGRVRVSHRRGLT